MQGLTRRQFVVGASACAGSVAAAALRSAAAETLPGPPFTLGIASGDPTSQSVVLWTRLAPDPLNGGGMPAMPVAVHWEVALDPDMQNVIRNGTVEASPLRAHSVHVDALGLPADSWLWYRFHAGGFASPTGRTRTFPSPGSPVSVVRFVQVSCQNYGEGFYSAYHNIVQEPETPAFVVHLGDYLYEFGDAAGDLRPVGAGEPATLDEYRNHYAVYKLDPQLQTAHAAFPFLHIWDDHEVVDGYQGDTGDAGAAASFLERRAAAYQAHYEHLPLRGHTQIGDAGSRLHRRFLYGDLVQLVVLDTRRRRSIEPCTPFFGSFGSICAQAQDPARTILGTAQEGWLARRLTGSTTAWNVVAQAMMLMRFGLPTAQAGTLFNLDAWDGYPAAQQRLIDALATTNDAIVLSGDFHSSWVADLKQDFADVNSATVASEFVTPSISTLRPTQLIGAEAAIQSLNPHIGFIDFRNHGYVHYEVTPTALRADYRVVDNIASPTAGVSTLASFLVTRGTPGAVQL